MSFVDTDRLDYFGGLKTRRKEEEEENMILMSA